MIVAAEAAQLIAPVTGLFIGGLTSLNLRRSIARLLTLRRSLVLLQRHEIIVSAGTWRHSVAAINLLWRIRRQRCQV